MNIIVKQTSIVIDGYELGDCPKIEGIFSVYNMTTHTSIPKGIEYIPEKKQLILPRGIDIPYIKSLFNTSPYLDRNNDPFDKIGDTKLKYTPRDDEQKEALKFMVGGYQYRQNLAKSQFCINLNTGKGKTYCSIATMMYFGIRSIVITSSIEWLEQWKRCILEYTNIKSREVYLLSGINSILKLKRADMSKYKIILASHNTIKSYGDNYGWDNVSELFKYMRVGLKFYDECHLNFDNMMKIDFYTNTFKTYYVSATPARSDRDEDRVYQLCFKNVPSIDLYNHDTDPHTAYRAIMYNSHPTPMQVSDLKNMYGLDRNRYIDYVIKTPNYEKMVIYLVNLALNQEGKTLFYIGTNKGILYTRLLILNTFPFLADDIGIFTSIVDKQNKKAQLDKKIILSTTKSCGAAMDIKDLKMTVVLAEPFSSKVIARQTLGRTRDNNTFYIEIVDVGFNTIYKYYYKKKPIFAEYATDCKETVFDDRYLDAKFNEIFNYQLQLRQQNLVSPFTFISNDPELVFPFKFN